MRSDDGAPDVAAAYSALIDYLKANCGFAELDVQAQEYAFVGIPEEVPAGPTVVTVENIGKEAHEFALFGINDDVTMTVEELLALPQEEAESMLTEVGGTFALPGQTGYTVIDLTPGRHVALCFVPQGTTMEVIRADDGRRGGRIRLGSRSFGHHRFGTHRRHGSDGDGSRGQHSRRWLRAGRRDRSGGFGCAGGFGSSRRGATPLHAWSDSGVHGRLISFG